jgi:hypothetical protein
MTRPAAVPHHGSTMSDVQTYTTPEAEHLADQERLLAELTEQLATKETEFATIGAELARFRVHYLRRFAPLYAEIDRLDAEIARHIAAKDDSRAAHARAAEAAARADESREAEAGAGEARVASDEVAERTQPPPELRDLYRQAAKKIHPDLAADDVERERRTALMASLNAAYEAGDADAIRRILAGEALRPEAIIGDDVASRLMRVIRKISRVRGRFTELAELSKALEADPLFALFAQSRVAWEAGEDPFAEDEASLRTRIASARAQLTALVMGAAREAG